MGSYEIGLSYVFVALGGAIVGQVELLARYRDAPWSAIFARQGVLYSVANTIAALCGFYLIRTFGWTFGLDGGNDTQILVSQVLVGAFGSMALFRSSILNLRVGDADISAGPALALQLILRATDREVDRLLARRRAAIVASACSGFEEFSEVKDALPLHCLALMQNVSAEEERNLNQVVQAIDSKEISEKLKVLNLGLVLLSLVGEDVLRTALDNVRSTSASGQFEKVDSPTAGDET